MYALIGLIRVCKSHLHLHGDHNLINRHIHTLVHTPVALSYLNKGSGTYGTIVTDTYTLSTCVKVNNPLMSVYMCLLRVKLVPILLEPSLF